MANEVLIQEVTKKKLYCPECGIETTHVYQGRVRIYSSWRCLVCGRSILGEPIQKLRTPPTFPP